MNGHPSAEEKSIVVNTFGLQRVLLDVAISKRGIRPVMISVICLREMWHSSGPFEYPGFFKF